MTDQDVEHLIAKVRADAVVTASASHWWLDAVAPEASSDDDIP